MTDLFFRIFQVAGIAVGVYGQANDAAFIRWASGEAVEISSWNGGARSAKEEAGLRRLVGDSPLVVMGEPVHGAREPLVFRNHMFRYLVEELGFTAIATETGVVEGIAVDRYINGGAGEGQKVGRLVFSWSRDSYPENVELVKWLREYNANPEHKRKIRFYGFDLTGGRNGGFPFAYDAVKHVIGYLKAAASQEAVALERRLEPYARKFNEQVYRDMPEADQKVVTGALEELGQLLAAYRQRLIALQGERSFALTERALENVRQLIARFLVTPKGDSLAALGPALTSRDRSMAENLLWALEHEGVGGKVAGFSHLAHMMSTHWEEGPIDEVPVHMGIHLRAKLGRRYLNIAHIAGEGYGLEPTEAHPLTRLNTALANVGVGAFVLDLRPGGKKPEVSGWLRATRPVAIQSATPDFRVSVLRGFDAVFYSKRLTESKR